MMLNTITPEINLNIAIVGCGDVGIRCAKILTDAGHRVIGGRRNIAALPDWIEARAIDVTDPATLAFLGEEQIDIVIYILAAAAFNPQDYRAAYVTGVENTLAAVESNPSPLKRFLFVSSTGVYHQNDGSKVDENSPTEPVRFNGQIVLQGEQLVRSNPVGTCARFSGIYGPDRLRMINRVAAGQFSGQPGDRQNSSQNSGQNSSQNKDSNAGSYTNRIHVDDCAGVLAHLVSLSAAGRELDDLYLASDCCPASSRDVENYIAQTLGLSASRPNNNTSQSKRIAGSKQCSNQRLLDSGYRFMYPDYKAGYLQVINNM